MKSPNDADADRLFQEALAFRDAEDFANMRDRLLKVVGLDQRNVTPIVLLSYAHEQCNELDAALEWSSKGIVRAPRSHLASCRFFHCLWNLEKFDEAIAEIERFMKIGTHPDYVEILDELREKGWIDGPRRDAERHQALGKAALDRGDLETARKEYEQAIAADPSDAYSHLFLGNLFYRQRAYDESLEEFQKAHQIEPESAMPHICMADTYHCMREMDLADQHYKRAVWLEPNDECAQQNLHRWEKIKADAAKESDESAS